MVFVGDPDDHVELRRGVFVAQTVGGDFAHQAGLAHPAQTDDQHDRRALAQPFDDLAERLRAAHEMIVCRRRQVVLDGCVARAARAAGVELLDQRVAVGVAGGVQKGLQPAAVEICAPNAGLGQNLDRARLGR